MFAMLGSRGEIVRRLAARLTVAAIWLADGVVEGESRRFDRASLLWIHVHSPQWLDGPMRIVTALGYYRVVLPLLAAVVYVFFLKGWRLSATLLLVSTLGGFLLTTFLKGVFERARPELFDSGYSASFYSFPSGHATAAVGWFARWTVVGVGVSLVLLIGFSRLYLGVHYPTDVLAGFLAAPLWLIFVGAVYVAWLSVRGLRAAELRWKDR